MSAEPCAIRCDVDVAISGALARLGSQEQALAFAKKHFFNAVPELHAQPIRR